MPVALSRAGACALIAPSPDRLGGLGLDQLLQHHAHRAADQLASTADAQGLPQLRCGSIRQDHRRVLLDESAMSSHRASRRWPPSGGPSQLPPNPTTRRDAAETWAQPPSATETSEAERTEEQIKSALLSWPALDDGTSVFT